MAMDMFIKIGELAGESGDSVHKDSIDVLAWSWGLSNSGSAHSGGGAGAGKVNVQDLSFTKWVDRSSPELMLACANGKHFDKALLTLRKAGEKPVEYLKLNLEDLMITSLSTGGSGGEDRLTENVTLSFAKYKIEYTPQKKDGSADKVVRTGWDIKANVKT
ncbi:MAG: type VI secretion system tube protein Hcp [Gammaproteobacteria bacterium]|nr:type VI secretion system tube protein Hcp [Gammaproteobacteria bacterium]